MNVTLEEILSRSPDETLPDQWEAQVFIRILQHAKVIYISDAPDDMVKALHMIPAHSIGEAMSITERILDNPNATITAIPDGVSVIVERNI
ncbi:MAG: hypothetical protein PHH84_06270 [Oscillospiraceae bacterium]|nr:hypothetical protein [Oscillospiraceae bacterium]